MTDMHDRVICPTTTCHEFDGPDLAGIWVGSIMYLSIEYVGTEQAPCFNTAYDRLYASVSAASRFWQLFAS